jgi:uncharacterized protein YheU (UPF0270 family)
MIGVNGDWNVNERINEIRLNVYYRLHEQVKEAVRRAVDYYMLVAEELKLDYQYRTWAYGTISEVYWNSVGISWEEYRRNCRVDSGHYSIPWEALADDTYKQYIRDFVTKQSNEQKTRAKQEALLELQRKQMQLAQLKRELGEA